MKDKHISGEQRLNALADGELDTFETEALLQEIKADPEMQRELCDIHLMKDMLKAAYPEQAIHETRSPFRKTNLLGAIAASFVFLCVGFIAGHWLTPSISEKPFELSMANTKSDKIVLYLGSSEQEKLNETLVKAEQLMRDYTNRNIQVDIVTSAGGIDLLRHQTSPYIDKVSQLAHAYDALAFVACNNTLSKLKKEGKDIDIIEEAVIAPSAVQYVVKRLQQGWSYVAI